MTTCKDIVRAIKGRFGRPNFITMANVYLIGSPWESDVVNISPAHYYTEFEIKLSRADYNADFRKKRYSIVKHELLAGKTYEGNRNAEFIPRPKQFYFVLLDGICQEKDVPDYCGMIVFEPAKFTPNWPAGALQIVRQAPVLKPMKKLPPKAIHNIAVKAASRID